MKRRRFLQILGLAPVVGATVAETLADIRAKAPTPLADEMQAAVDASAEKARLQLIEAAMTQEAMDYAPLMRVGEAAQFGDFALVLHRPDEDEVTAHYKELGAVTWTIPQKRRPGFMG